VKESRLVETNIIVGWDGGSSFENPNPLNITTIHISH